MPDYRIVNIKNEKSYFDKNRDHTPKKNMNGDKKQLAEKKQTKSLAILPIHKIEI